MQSVGEQLEKLACRQEESASKVVNTIDEFISDIEMLSTVLADESLSNEDSQLHVMKLATSLKKKNYPKKTTTSRKEFRSTLTRFGKTVERIPSNPTPSENKWDCNKQLINQAIAHHFCHEGKFETCKIFTKGDKESKLDENQFTQEPYSGMHHILQELEKRNIYLLLQWVTDHNEFIVQHDSTLEFQIRKIQFIEILQQGDKLSAIRHSQQYFAKFNSKFMKDIKELMMLLVKPNVDLDMDILYSSLKITFTEDYCVFHKIPKNSLLYSTTMVGAMSLPSLMKMAKLKGAPSWADLDQLTIEIELPLEFHYHSTFICPVSKESTSPSNPPMLLSCGHAISKSSMKDLSKYQTAQFKCPYCQSNQLISQCQQLYF